MHNKCYQILIFIIFFVFNIFILANDNVEVNVVNQDENHVILEYIISDFSINEINIKNETYHKLSLSDEPNFITKYNPSLPHINRSLIIPEVSSINVTVIEYETIEYDDINILPSKGNPPRNIDINKIPYVKGEVYLRDANYPGDLYEIHDPYILRDYRGQVLQINPFQYNPMQKKLLVYSNITIRIEFNGNNTINTLNDRRNNVKLAKDYHYMYSDRFINYSTYQTRYNPIDEDGEMLVI